nr:TonB-dependent receptor [Pseudomonas bharatica]
MVGLHQLQRGIQTPGTKTDGPGRRRDVHRADDRQDLRNRDQGRAARRRPERQRGAVPYHREHQAAIDPAYPDPAFSYSGACCYLAQDRIVSKGLDLEASGEITPGWEVLAGYTYNRVQNDTEETLYSTITPRHLFKLWSIHTLPGALSAVRVGGGITAQSPTYVTGQAYRLDAAGNAIDSRAYDFSQAGYAVYDALVEYKVDQNWTVALKGNNLFDRRYYESVGTSEYGNYYGEPRNFTLTLRGVFD